LNKGKKNNQPRLGSVPRQRVHQLQDSRREEKGLAVKKNVHTAGPGMKTKKESKKLTKEGQRILRMKNKPTKRKLGDQDLPTFKKGGQWRGKNQGNRVREAISRNQQFNK